jgi:hypothetical protein
MYAKLIKVFGTNKRELVLRLTQDDIDKLPETLRQEFLRAEHSGRSAQIISAWARIAGLMPSDPQADLFDGEEEETGEEITNHAK